MAGHVPDVYAAERCVGVLPQPSRAQENDQAMNRQCCGVCCGRALCLVALSLSSSLRAEPQGDAAKALFFEKRVRPVLVEHCHMCHGPDKQEGGLRLDSFDAMVTGGDSGPAIVPGNVQDSLLADAIRYGDTVQMPPNEQLSKKQIDSLIQWIEDGAVWPKKQPSKK